MDDKANEVKDAMPKVIWVCNRTKKDFYITPIKGKTKYHRLSDDDLVISRGELQALRKGNLNPDENNGHTTLCVEDQGFNNAIDKILELGK